MGWQASRKAPASLVSFGHGSVPATATYRPQIFPVRVVRAVGALVACWTAAAIGALLPLQLLTVPRLFLGGLSLARYHLRDRQRLVTVDGACPRCRVAQEFRPDLLFPIERQLHCRACRHAVILED